MEKNVFIIVKNLIKKNVKKFSTCAKHSKEMNKKFLIRAKQWKKIEKKFKFSAKHLKEWNKNF